MVISNIVSMLEAIADTKLMTALSDAFSVMIIENNFVYINFWSFLHLFLGFLIMFLIYKYQKKCGDKFFRLFVIIIAIELFEFAFVAGGSSFFRKDPKLDTIWDLIIGMLGGYLYVYLKGNGKIK